MSDERLRELLERLHGHVAAMAPYQRERAGAKLIMEAIDVLEELYRGRLLQELKGSV